MKPVKVTDVDLAFGGKTSELLPPIEKIPEEFKNGQNKWNDVVNDWFFKGLSDCIWSPKEGINTEDALRHIQAIMNSFSPKHEHKQAGCAFLLSQFFNEVEYETTKA